MANCRRRAHSSSIEVSHVVVHPDPTRVSGSQSQLWTGETGIDKDGGPSLASYRDIRRRKMEDMIWNEAGIMASRVSIAIGRAIPAAASLFLRRSSCYMVERGQDENQCIQKMKRTLFHRESVRLQKLEGRVSTESGKAGRSDPQSYMLVTTLLPG